MKHYKTLLIMDGMNIKNFIARFLHKTGKIKVMYEVPVTDEKGDRIGGVYTLRGSKRAMKLMKTMFDEGVGFEPMTLEKRNFEVI